MALQTVYSSESWEKIYTAFNQVNFSAFDFNTIKSSLLQYAQTYYAESFNDLIESSEFIMLIESFAFIAEQLSYRLDMLSHESFITTAVRKQSILKLAKLISYKPTRNIPARGMVKITSIATSQSISDANGNQLKNQIIIWNDPNNANWKAQFFLLMDNVITTTFGQYVKSVQIGNVAMQTYVLKNVPSLLKNGVYDFNVNNGLQTFPMEVVPMDVDNNGPFEKTPDINSQLSFAYTNDGLGDSSDYTGFQFLIKQGILANIPYTFSGDTPNNSLTLNSLNVNDTDVWVNQVDSTGKITKMWTQVQSLLDQNIIYNTISDKTKYEVESLENDKIKLIFGDGDFAVIPNGQFHIWVRQSLNQSIVIQPNNIVNQQFSFQYTSSKGTTETCTLTFSLMSTIQNSAPSESLDHIRQAAPSTYYAQNRMVNGQDYNTYMLKDQSILRLNSINRTFAGQPKYIQWNDASGQYENIKLFGDDLSISQEIAINTINTNSTIIGRNLIDNVIEPLLASNGIINLLNFINVTQPSTAGIVTIPRKKFIEDNRQFYFNDPGVNGTLSRTSLQEKTNIQGAIDQHWYGEPLTYISINNINYAVIKDPALYPEFNGNIWASNTPRTIDKVNPYIPGDVGSGIQSLSNQQNFGLCFNNNSPMIGSLVTFTAAINSRALKTSTIYADEVFTIEVAANNSDIYVSSSVRGAIGTGMIGKSFALSYPNSPIDFILTQDASAAFALYYGDTFRIELLEVSVVQWDSNTPTSDKAITVTPTTSTYSTDLFKVTSLNMLGRWEIIPGIDLMRTTSNPNTLPFDPSIYLPNGSYNPNSWIIWVKQNLNPVTQQATSFVVNFREVSLQVSSANTNFWYNSNQKLLDSQTQDVVYDQIRVLRSNLKPDNTPLGTNEVYNVVGPIKDSTGVIDVHSLEIMVSDALLSPTGGSMLPNDIMQFENFIAAANNSSPFYIYFELDAAGNEITGTDNTSKPAGVSFNPGAFVSLSAVGGIYYGRRLTRKGIDFMWQHFTDYSNLVDPSVSNIHDMYLITQGYYDNMINYLRGLYSYVPQPPTPLELRNSYGYLLNNKMMSDTVVLHSGTFKLLFGSLAEPQLRGQFRIVMALTATLSQEAIKNEVLTVINSYFSIANWDFGQTFYVTELLGLIHQRLPTEIATVVLVPTYAINSFGSLFQVQCGIDEILMSAATLDDIAIVSELNSTILRQS